MAWLTSEGVLVLVVVVLLELLAGQSRRGAWAAKESVCSAGATGAWGGGGPGQGGPGALAEDLDRRRPALQARAR
jgi:hypothetical protein